MIQEFYLSVSLREFFFGMRDSNILRFKLSFLAVLAISVGLSVSSDVNITIFRDSTTVPFTKVSNSYDVFHIFSNYCRDSVDHCESFGGKKLKIQGNCNCSCGEEQSTFGYYNGKWKCTENSIVRQHAGKTNR